MNIKDAKREILATPLGTVIATAMGVLIANEELLRQFPNGVGAPPELRQYAQRISQVSLEYSERFGH